LEDEQAPFIGDALEIVRTTIAELETRARHQVPNSAGDEHLIRASHGGDAGSDMHRNADNAVTCELALAGVQPSAYLKSQRVYPFADGTRATYSAGRAIEGGKQAVASSIHLAAATAMTRRPERETRQRRECGILAIKAWA
jgi:hypothetical protein